MLLLVFCKAAPCSKPWACPVAHAQKCASLLMWHACHCFMVMFVCTGIFYLYFSIERMFCCFSFNKKNKIVFSDHVVYLFTAENAWLPQGEKGRGLLSEPGWPDAVMQVSTCFPCFYLPYLSSAPLPQCLIKLQANSLKLNVSEKKKKRFYFPGVMEKMWTNYRKNKQSWDFTLENQV